LGACTLKVGALLVDDAGSGDADWLGFRVRNGHLPDEATLAGEAVIWLHKVVKRAVGLALFVGASHGVWAFLITSAGLHHGLDLLAGLCHATAEKSSATFGISLALSTFGLTLADLHPNSRIILVDFGCLDCGACIWEALIVVLARLPGQLPFKHVVGVMHAPVELSMAHLPVLAFLQVDDAHVLLEVVGLVAQIHTLQAVVALALEPQALVVLALQEIWVLASPGQGREHVRAMHGMHIVEVERHH
jgi:hypothetical protein